MCRANKSVRVSFLLSVVAVLIPTKESSAQVQPGDILIYDRGELRAVRQDGTPVPGFEVSIPNQMEGLTTGPGGAIYFTGAGAPGSPAGVYRVNPQTGAITTITTATSPSADYFRGIAVEPTGSLVVSTLDNDILRIDPTTGARTTLVPVGGFLTYAPFLQVGPDGTIYASSQNAQGYYIARVNPVTGAQTTVTSGQFFTALKGFAVAPDNTLYAANVSHASPAPGEEMGQILRIDPAAGHQSVLYTSNTNPTDVFNPYGIAVDPQGNVLVADQQSPSNDVVDGAVFRFDRLTGARSLVYAGGRLEQDPQFVAVVVPERATLSLCLMAGAGVFLRRPCRVAP